MKLTFLPQILVIQAIVLVCRVSSQSWRQLGPQNDPPSRISRIRGTLRGTKVVMGVSYSNPQVLDVFNFRVRWSEPYEWGDRGALGKRATDFTPSRAFDLVCWFELNDEVVSTFMDRRLKAYLTGYSESFRFPPDYRGTIRCKVRAVNARGLTGPWRFSRVIRIDGVPIYFPGLEGIDLRGLPNDKILNILTKAGDGDFTE